MIFMVTDVIVLDLRIDYFDSPPIFTEITAVAHGNDNSPHAMTNSLESHHHLSTVKQKLCSCPYLFQHEPAIVPPTTNIN